MNELLEKENIKIENMIYQIRGKQVMLSSDIARIYKVETKTLNQVVKRNINRFPENFCFQLTKDEYIILRSQNVTSSKINNPTHGGNRYLPYVFTEHGIIMLSGLLKSNIAVEANKKIVIAFVSMRKYFSNNPYEKRISNVETKLIEHDNKINLILDKIDKQINNNLFYEGQIYDAYSLMISIFDTSSTSIIIIDNYIDKTILNILSKTTKDIIIVTNKYNNDDYNKYKAQYKNVKLKINNSFHDRFIIIDEKTLYHCGASFKDLGKKCFAITKIEDNNYLIELLKKIK